MKSGDKVRVRNGNYEGLTGTVVADSQPGEAVEVELDDQSTAWHEFDEQALEPLR